MGMTVTYAQGPDGRPRTKHIFVTGGVVSSLGKGLTASSLGRLLRSRGLDVVMQKLDPYINVDPGTMNPFQHGEVFVTDDGSETDLDIGHYERFLDVNLTGAANATTGQIYSNVIAAERRGDYLGDTVQVIPHITDEIKRVMRSQADGEDAPDIIITEIGGTVGDIESQPFLEAARQVHAELGRENCLFIHVSLVPYLDAAGEVKTKPTQHSVASLRSIGITPDALVCRCERPLARAITDKIALMCGVDAEAVVECPDAPSIYLIPQTLHDQGLDAYIVRRLGVSFRDVEWSEWNRVVARATNPRRRVRIGVVGKYVDLHDAYLSVSEAIKAGGFAHDAQVELVWIAADTCADEAGAERALADVDGIVVPGGFGIRGIEGKLGALTWARTHALPCLGICLGLQCMVIEAARNLCNLPEATSTEMDPDTSTPVVTTMDDQQRFVSGGGDLGGTMRLGAYPAQLREGSVVERLYGRSTVSERHRHRFEVNTAYAEALEKAGLHISGTSPDGSLVEFVELDAHEHPYYLATQAHPEFTSRPTRPHPLFAGLVEAALARQERRSR